MPNSLHTIPAIVTVIALGVLFGLGFSLAQLAIGWPTSRVAVGAAFICLLIVIIAYLV